MHATVKNCAVVPTHSAYLKVHTDADKNLSMQDVLYTKLRCLPFNLKHFFMMS